MKYNVKYGKRLEIGVFNGFIYFLLSLIEQNFDFVQCYISENRSMYMVSSYLPHLDFYKFLNVYLLVNY